MVMVFRTFDGDDAGGQADHDDTNTILLLWIGFHKEGYCSHQQLVVVVMVVVVFALVVEPHLAVRDCALLIRRIPFTINKGRQRKIPVMSAPSS